MKDRSSLRKAEWTKTREIWYRKEAEKMLFERELTLSVEDDEVYLTLEDIKAQFLTITKPKATWYEIWLKLKSVPS